MLLGSAGLLGLSLQKSLGSDHKLIKISRSVGDYRIDATDPAAIAKVISKEKPEVVINAIKNNFSTDESEVKKAETWETNVSIPENLARLQKKNKFLLVHISSDWIFEGKVGEVYNEDSLPNPQNFYSYTKCIAEERIRGLAEDYLIFRPTGIFGIDPRGANFFMRVKKAAETKSSVPASKNQLSKPIYAAELAEIIKTAIKKDLRGTYNSVGKDYISRHDLGLLFCEIFGWDKKTIAYITESRALRIPNFLNVDTSKTEKEIRKINPLRVQIENLKKEVYNE